jgi:hypothetical protein
MRNGWENNNNRLDEIMQDKIYTASEQLIDDSLPKFKLTCAGPSGKNK